MKTIIDNIVKEAKWVKADEPSKKIFNEHVRPFIFQLKNDSVGFRFPKSRGEEIDLMEDLIKKKFKDLKLTQISDVGTKPIEIEIKTKNPKNFISELKTIFDKIFM